MIYFWATSDRLSRGLDAAGHAHIFTHMETLRNSREILRRLAAEGWEEVSVRGSHHKFRKEGRVVIVPHPKKDLPIGTARSIARMAGWLEDKE
ncbi:type II toxin-antitoxin system HicA family toxin [Paracoccus thiocyanatus]|nr:type II toxin-antitoxin system HicA family toxin [Paracoccus thiocyanatus]